MNAPSIPNLLSLRGNNGGGRGRGSGRGGRGGSSSRRISHDETIQGTDTDAAMSRMSAVELGYLEDPFAQHLKHPEARVTRRLPIINRGTYVRTSAIDSLVESWTSFFREDNADRSLVKTNAQIISLGAGSDTRAFRMFSDLSPAPHEKIGDDDTPRTAHGLVYHEIDFKVIMDDKAQAVNLNGDLREALPQPMLPLQQLNVPGARRQSAWRNGIPNGSQLWLHGLDLRDLTDEESAPTLPGLIPEKPTLLISECCLCYLETQEAAKVIKYFKDRIPRLSIILYEPIRPDDAFGRQMTANLAARGIRMPTVEVYKTPEDQVRRIREAGFTKTAALTIDQIWDLQNPSAGARFFEERERVDQIEGLDEVEEWKLLADHYVIAYGYPGGDEKIPGWGLRYHEVHGLY